MIAPVRRLISLAILVGWLAPIAAALGVGMHLASDHHGDHDQHGLEHEQVIADLVRAPAHGHQHDLDTVPDHRYEARFGGQTAAPRHDLAAVAVLPTEPPSSGTLGEVGPRDQLLRGLPRPLFEVNCVLLI